MTHFNFQNKTFRLLDNSPAGKASEETLFYYKQDGDLVTADYFGGSIVYGKIIARMQGDQLHMLYQCLTGDDELMAGKATATISLTEDGKIHLKLHWQWLEDVQQSGTSEYQEV